MSNSNLMNILQRVIILTGSFALIICTSWEKAQGARGIKYSGGSNGPINPYSLIIDTSVLDTDPDPNKGFFSGALQLELTNASANGENSISLSGLDIVSFIDDLSPFPAESNGDLGADPGNIRPFPQAVYQVKFPTFTVQQTSFPSIVYFDELNIYIRPKEISNFKINSLTPLEDLNLNEESFDDIPGIEYFVIELCKSPIRPDCPNHILLDRPDPEIVSIPDPKPVPEPVSGMVIGLGVFTGSLLWKRRRNPK